MKGTPEQRFWARVKKTSTCWLWTGAKIPDGYGSIWVEGKPTAAHRISWEIHHGKIPNGMCVLHDCPGGDNPACVNPKHLFLGTKQDNAIDREKKGRGVDTSGEKKREH